MRLERLDLTRYGRFTDRSLSFPPPAPGAADLHILYGPNEAGKSTLFAAWLDLLFGIPTRTRYDFLHPGPTLQIGARLSHPGGTLEIRRLKRNSASLTDLHGAALPEASLQAALGGLARDGYSAMFSLDDETLERGGESILSSRGDLGQMLFSASAGLSGLVPQLETLRQSLDGFHRSGKRSGWLYDAKKQLGELERQRRDLDISAGTLQRLSKEAQVSEQAWQEARALQEGQEKDFDRLQELAGTLPLLARLARLQDHYAPLRDLPEASDALQQRFERAGAEREKLTNRIRDRALRLQGLADQRADLSPDPLVLARAEDIEAAEALRPEHDSARNDLPRRRTEAAEAQAQLSDILAQLGQAGADPQKISLAPARMAALRALLTARSGLQNSAGTAALESRRAADFLERETARLGDPGPAEDEAALAALVSRLRSQDPADALARALRDRDQALSRVDAALLALAPWRGDAAALTALAPPAGWQIADWETTLEASRTAEHDARRDAATLRDDISRLGREAAGREAAHAASGVTLSDAAGARRLREAQWAAHLSDLNAASARRFEQALREDDRISVLLAETMAEARRAAQDQAALASAEARLEAAESRLEAALTAQSATTEAVQAASRTLGLSGSALADLKSWLDLRIRALSEITALRDAEAGLTRSKATLEAAAQLLRAALGAQAEAPLQAFELLLATAVARIEASERRREARQHLTTLAADLRERRQAEADAAHAFSTWRSDWSTATRDTLLAAFCDDDPALSSVLDLLDQLSVTAQKAHSLQDRVAKMEANCQRFSEAKSAALAALEMAQDQPWSDVLQRLRRAQDAARDHDSLDGQIAREGQDEAQDQRALAACAEEIAGIGTLLGWTESESEAEVAGSLADHLRKCREAAGLRLEIDELQKELRDRPAPAAEETPDAVRQRLLDLRAALFISRAGTESRLTSHLEAKSKAEAVGGDDQLARIAAERENLLLELREKATAHLTQKFGLIAFEAGLRRYRDQHRSTMMTRASEAFSRLSRGAYSGLAAQPDGAQEVLVALSAAGGAKLAADLSKGARFQLYLALRIAGYHELAQSRSTVPFIADDIMETFDDDRSGAAFTLLADMSRVGQVIYLTHHRHLCDIAKSACPDANIIEL
ncbi:ATP-binding protein [Falsigemmobacter faecalis]|uniref:Chromosome segregation protein SMC n=1 Tax=Falsigemmobacter faecalis TaxID=2488730 RepID=A0A3P3DJP3_9RHOB|nr:YhaN family protein [Falsigemmobacter faecalis]RRH73822.1 chromosome segregation protein SMC [Falsigemmobacter faecalis]